MTDMVGFAYAEDLVGTNDRLLAELRAALWHQHYKWGQQSHAQVVWFAILGEEFGEVGKAVCELSLLARGASAVQNLREELLHTAAVAIAMAESLDRVGFDGS